MSVFFSHAIFVVIVATRVDLDCQTSKELIFTKEAVVDRFVGVERFTITR